VSGNVLINFLESWGCGRGAVEIRGPGCVESKQWLLERRQSRRSPEENRGFDERVNVWFDTGESRVGADIWFEDKETSYSSDVRSGYDEDQPPARLVEEPSEDDVDSDAAVIAAGDDDD